MNKLIDVIKSIYKIKELRERILFTLMLLLVYRLGAQVVLPGVDSLALSDLSSRSDGGGLLGILNAFTGGAFANASIFALGIMHKVTACFFPEFLAVPCEAIIEPSSLSVKPSNQMWSPIPKVWSPSPKVRSPAAILPISAKSIPTQDRPDFWNPSLSNSCCSYLLRSGWRP